MKNTEKENPARRNAYSMAVRNAEEENWMPVVYYDETVSECSRYTWLEYPLSMMVCVDTTSRDHV